MLNFTWEGLDGATTALQRLRTAAAAWGEPDTPDEAFMHTFQEQINSDLNMPRALAVTWDLVKSDLPAAAKKATLLQFDQVLGLGLAGWQPVAVSIPVEILALATQRQQARAEKRWQEADALRAQLKAAGYEVEDTPQGPRVRVATR